MIRNAILFVMLAAAATAQSWPGYALGFEPQASAGHEDSDYENGRRALDASQWDKAIELFSASVARKGPAADGALYWKAYAQDKAGRRDEALTTIAALRKSYPSSKWSGDAQALAMEIHGATGVSVKPAADADEELKLMAINSLMQSDPKEALPILERLLRSNNSEKVKERALFVLTQSGQPEAAKVLADIARGNSMPELQLKAINYIGMMGSAESRQQLASIYTSSSNKDIKHAILRSFMQSGSRDFLLNVAKNEADPDLRHDAIKQLFMAGGQEELWQLYQTSSSIDEKEQILKNMFMGGNSSRLVEVARTEKDPRLRIAAIKSLGLMGNNGHGDVLVTIYRSDQNRDVRAAVLNALFIQQDGKALVDLARAETDPEMKREIVKKMSLIQTKETTDYMMEILNK